MTSRERLVLLGTKGGPALRPGGPRPTSSLLELAGRRVVVDCGLGVTQGLVAAGVDLRELDLVFVTHLHSDHVLELGPLLHTAWTTGLHRPVTVWGPAGLAQVWVGFLASLAYDVAVREADEARPPFADLVRLRTLTEGDLDDPALAPLRVRALRVPHPPVGDVFALRFDAPDRAVAFSADTAHHPPLAAFARGVDVLVHEAMLPEGVDRLVAATGLGEPLRRHLHASHTTVDDACAIAAAAGAGRLVLHHLIPADDPEVTVADWARRAAAAWSGPTTVGRDGLELALRSEGRRA